MREWTGWLRRTDVGTGVWSLEADDGERYQLAGEVPADLSGRRVVVEGRAVDAFGFGMTGPSIEVSRARKA